MKINKKKIIAIIGLVLVALALVFAIIKYVDNYNEQKYLQAYGEVAVYVGEYEATYDLYRYFYLNYQDILGESITEPDQLDSAVRAKVLDALKGLYGTLALAADYGITINDGDVKVATQEYIDATIDYYKQSGESFEAQLEYSYMSENIFRLLMGVDSVETKLFNKLVADEDIIASDNESLHEIFMGNDFVRAKQIFIENDEGESLEDNRALAEQALEQYLDGEDPDILIGRYSEDYSMPSEGYYFTHLEMIDEFEATAYALQDGEVSDVVESENGFHIIIRLPKDEAYINDNFEDLRSQYQNSCFYMLIENRANSLSARESSYVRSLSAEEIW